MEGLALSLLLSLLFLSGCIWWVWPELKLVLAGSKVMASIGWESAITSVLSLQLAAFAIAALFIYLLLGLTAWGLTRLTIAAFPEHVIPRQFPVLIAWTMLLVLLVLAANGTWFPASRFASEDSWLLTNRFGQMPLFAVLAAVGAVTIGLVLLALRRAGPHRPAWLRGFFAMTVAAIAFGILPLLGPARSHAVANLGHPHVVIIGVDSLRDNLSEVSTDRGLTPNIDEFLHDSHRFRDAISPLARTYPSWVSILTGRHPVSTNARVNLIPRTLVHEGDTLADALRARGYRSVYATDEVRFANFDESFGFDQLISPPVGAVDFLLGEFGDLPLVNLVAVTRLGAWLFPSNHANRAAAVTYRPDDFVSRLDRELSIAGPSFLAIHLTLSHWPYSWAGLAEPTTPQEFRPAYRHAIEEVDRQFAKVVDLLERKGVLDNAIVVVLSDHGEALGFPSDTMLRETGTDREIWNSIWGHGTSVMSPHQYSVLLAMRACGRATLPGAAAAHTWPVSLEDVRPTLEDYVTGIAPTNVDGVSLLPFLAASESTATLDTRVRFTETDFNTPMMLEGKISRSGLLHEGARYYELVPDSGWVQLRPNRLPEIMSKKQRAAISRSSLLAAIPSWTDGSVTYLFTSRQSPFPRRLSGRPDPQEDPEAARLWDALQARFPGELPPDPALPQM